MDLLDLFKIDNFKKVSFKLSNNESVINEPLKAPEKFTNNEGTEYVKKYVDEENKKALQDVSLSNFKNDGKNFDEISLGTVLTGVDKEEITRVYNTFNFDYRPNDLPINQNKEEIINMIETHSITIIEGVTGCGKSTQVPQFILNNAYNRRKYCNIIVTQPRRIAAMSIAERVCKERGWQLGTLIGCQVGMYRNISNDTRLTYCTTGVLLRKLIKAKNMLDYTHIILDEIHERHQDMDFLLLIIRKFLRINSRQVKIILMSATFDVSKFSEYFSVPTESGFVPAPVISIPKKRQYKVHIHYLCQLRNLGPLPEISLSKPFISEKMILFCIKLINVFDDIDSNSEYDYDDVQSIDGQNPKYAVLIFLPGIWEIEQMYNIMTTTDESSKWDIVIMHSSITHNEQSKIFTSPPKGCRRIILSTNITESSITINDIKYVIDFCLTKQLITDYSSNFQCLELAWACKANCDQRAGRAGRIMDGRVYRFMPKIMYEALPNEARPDILCSPLENLILQTKLLNMGEPKAILALAIDPPDLTNLERTILHLKETGGLVDKQIGIDKFDGEITDLGRIMAALPLDIRISKLLALGHVFSVLRDTIIMGASMSVKSVFSNPFTNRIEAYDAQTQWTDNSSSDCLAFLNAYNVWRKEIMTNRLKKKTAWEYSWGKRHFIEIKAMHEVDYLIGDLTARLENLGIRETLGPKKIIIDHVDRSFLLKAVIAGAFYPNYFVRSHVPDASVGDTEITRTLGGLDPMRTVYLQGWRLEQPGRLYSKRIQQIFKGLLPLHDQMLVEFDGSKKVYLMFTEDKNYSNDSLAKTSNKILPNVYKAVKLRQLTSELTVPVLDAKTANKMAKDLKITTNICSMFFNEENYAAMKKVLPPTLPNLPHIDDSIIPIKIIYFENPSKFWVHLNDEDTREKLHKIEHHLNYSEHSMLKCFETLPSIGSLVFVKWSDKKMHRAVVESYSLVKGEDIAKVFFIDFGYRKCYKAADLLVASDTNSILNTSALALECKLSGVKPSKKYNAGDTWSKRACEVFNEYTAQYELFGVIYCVVDSVISLELMCETDYGSPVKLNDVLVEQGLAIPSEENFLSKYNHKLRDNTIDFNNAQKEYLKYLQYDKNYMIRTYPEPPDVKDCRSNIVLKGPYSPLEINLTSLALSCSGFKVNVNPSSINSVLLDSNPENSQQCLLVASSVKQNQSGTYLALRYTTLMPNISGLTSLICLLFAPKIELRRSASGSHYVGALCGLGCNSVTGAPLLQEHDLEVYFDTEINNEDLLDVNRLRHWMNMAICVKTEGNDNFDEQAVQCQFKVQKLFRKLIDRPIKPLCPEKIQNFHKWKLYDETLFLYPNKEVVKLDSIYPLHCALQLKERDKAMEDMLSHINDLRSLASSDVKLKENIEIYCKLCDVDMYGREALRRHLFMPDHRNREKSFKFEI